jgi:uncharacterized protein YhhL (DUF1145 family)
MNRFLKANCIALYLLALLALVAELPFGAGPIVQKIALIMLLVHAIEVPLALGKIQQYRGPLAVSIGLTLLFGFLHWRPLSTAPASSPQA